MTDDEIAAASVAVKAIEAAARARRDAVAGTNDADEYGLAEASMRQAGALKQALHNWIVARATRAHTPH